MTEKISTPPNKSEVADTLEQRRLALSQFKKIYENRGDIVNAIEYHAYEMDAYLKILRTQKPKTFSREWFDTNGERFNLYLNKISSFYGNNWLKALMITISVNWSFFTLYCFMLGFRPGTNFHEFYRLFSFSFEFLNPLRKADFITDTVPPSARIVDYLSRIFVSYFAYQLIQAFRKFGKKSI